MRAVSAPVVVAAFKGATDAVADTPTFAGNALAVLLPELSAFAMAWVIPSFDVALAMACCKHAGGTAAEPGQHVCR